MRFSKKRCFGCLVLIAVFLLFTLLFKDLFLGYVENEMYVRKTMRNLDGWHFPASRKVLKTNYVGILSGNGNHCDIVCLILYETEKDNTKLKERLDMFHGNRNVHFIKGKDDIDDGSLGHLNIYRQLESSIKAKMSREDKDYFYIYEYYNGAFNGDPRCM